MHVMDSPHPHDPFLDASSEKDGEFELAEERTEPSVGQNWGSEGATVFSQK